MGIKDHVKTAVLTAATILSVEGAYKAYTDYQDMKKENMQESIRVPSYMDNATKELFVAAYNGDLKAFEKALDKGADINAPNEDGRNVFMYALNHAYFPYADNGDYPQSTKLAVKKNENLIRYMMSRPDIVQNLNYKMLDNYNYSGLDYNNIHLSQNAEIPTPEIVKEVKAFYEKGIKAQEKDNTRFQETARTKIDAFNARLAKNDYQK